MKCLTALAAGMLGLTGLIAGPAESSNPAGVGLAAPILAPGTNPLPVIEITREAALPKITFAGTLESAAQVSGPWTDVTNASNPHFPDAAESRRFFRARGVGSIFSARSVLEMTVAGPLQQHFELALAGMPDGIFPPARPKPYFDGTAKLGSLERPVTLRVRGNSSLQECPFPKLKLKISKEQRAGTPFADAREIKIGTHCAEGGRGSIGRLRDERAAFREALAYEAMDLLGFITPRVRRARIDYRDTTPAQAESETGWQIKRHAVILEDIEVLAERLGGRALTDEEIAALKDAGFDPHLLINLELWHALLGNWDYALPPNGQGLWNTEVIEMADAKLTPVASDFDLCSWVTEEVLLSAPWDYHPELEPIDRQARFRVEEIQKQADAPSFAAAKARFTQKRAALEATINTAEVDDAGRTNALRHVTAFYGALATTEGKPR